MGEASKARPAAPEEHTSSLGALLRPLLLLELAIEPTHGYALVERLEDLGVKPKGASKLYRELRELEDRGWIKSAWEASQTRGPARRTYRVTRAGTRALEAAMLEVSVMAHALNRSMARYDLLRARQPPAPRGRAPQVKRGRD
jgi:PadR family transcriptional regulator, regulatory protein PadR